MNTGSNARSWWLVVGAVLGGTAVVTGAFGAHGLPEKLQEIYGTAEKTVNDEQILAWKKYLADFKTAAEYQMYHALGILAVGLLTSPRCSKSRSAAGWTMLLGTLLFSGSLYILVLTGQTWLGMITPIGGVLMIVGWALLAFAACPCGGGACETHSVPAHTEPSQE